jgi:glycerol-3-phosphate dehydrogenase
VEGIIAKDLIAGRHVRIKAKAVVFCGGPFTDSLRSLEAEGELEDSQRAVAAGGGSHIVLPGYYCPEKMGLLDMNTSDGRFLFFLPWLGHTVVGTTDTYSQSPTSSPRAPEDEVQWILNEAARYLSDDLRVRRSDVMSSWRGFRPLARDPHAAPGAPASRDHVISVNPATGVTFIAGGKWTTYREMAEDTIDRVVADHQLEAGECVTLKTALIGAPGYSDNLPIKLIQKYSISEEAAQHLATAYGGRAWDVCELAEATGQEWPRYGRHIAEGYPYIEAEVRYACQEYVRHVSDYIAFRSRLAFLNTHAAGQAIGVVADIMAEELHWDTATKQREVAQARALLAEFGGPVPDKAGATLRAATATDLHATFKAIDADGSGFIDATELQQASHALGFKLRGAELRVAFAAMDPNGDGKVSFEEFSAWWNSYDGRASMDGAPNRDPLLQVLPWRPSPPPPPPSHHPLVEVFRNAGGRSWADAQAVSGQEPPRQPLPGLQPE